VDHFDAVESTPDLAACTIRIQSDAPMSLHPQDPPSAPEETSRVARAAFPKGTLCLHIAEALGAIYPILFTA
jgi:hypothetical protein